MYAFWPATPPSAPFGVTKRSRGVLPIDSEISIVCATNARKRMSKEHERRSRRMATQFITRCLMGLEQRVQESYMHAERISTIIVLARAVDLHGHSARALSER